MKVLYILHDSDMGGSNISLLNLMSGMKNKGIEIVAVVPNIKEVFKDKLITLGIRYYNCPIVMSILWPSWRDKSLKGKCGYILRLLKSKYNSYKQLKTIIEKEKPDIIHTNVGVVQEGYFCARRLKIPHVWHLREYQDRDFNWSIFPSKWIFKSLLHNSYVISITKDIHKAFNLTKNEKHRVIYNGILPQNRTILNYPKKKYFLCASRISKEKGHDDVVRAFAIFHKSYPDYMLLILGYGDKAFIQELKDLGKHLGCYDNIIFRGYTDNVIDYMKDATALIVASRNEGFGRMTAEAAFAGCLVIGRNTGGTKEIIEEIGGLRFNKKEELLHNMFVTADMTEQTYINNVLYAQTKAKELYSNEKNINNVYKLYLDIINNS